MLLYRKPKKRENVMASVNNSALIVKDNYREEHATANRRKTKWIIVEEENNKYVINIPTTKQDPNSPGIVFGELIAFRTFEETFSFLAVAYLKYYKKYSYNKYGTTLPNYLNNFRIIFNGFGYKRNKSLSNMFFESMEDYAQHYSHFGLNQRTLFDMDLLWNKFEFNEPGNSTHILLASRFSDIKTYLIDIAKSYGETKGVINKFDLLYKALHSKKHKDKSYLQWLVALFYIAVLNKDWSVVCLYVDKVVLQEETGRNLISQNDALLKKSNIYRVSLEAFFGKQAVEEFEYASEIAKSLPKEDYELYCAKLYPEVIGKENNVIDPNCPAKAGNDILDSIALAMTKNCRNNNAINVISPSVGKNTFLKAFFNCIKLDNRNIDLKIERLTETYAEISVGFDGRELPYSNQYEYRSDLIRFCQEEVDYFIEDYSHPYDLALEYLMSSDIARADGAYRLLKEANPEDVALRLKTKEQAITWGNVYGKSVIDIMAIPTIPDRVKAALLSDMT